MTPFNSNSVSIDSTNASDENPDPPPLTAKVPSDNVHPDGPAPKNETVADPASLVHLVDRPNDGPDFPDTLHAYTPVMAVP